MSSNSSSKKIIVTVDGPAASGKSSLAKAAAVKFGMEHVDVGVVFRLITLHLMKVDFKFDQSPKSFLKEELNIEFKGGKFFLDGEEVSRQIRDREVTLNAAKMGADKSMRDKVYEIERAIAAKKKAVIFSGRDTGAVVFPNADLKFYVNASIEKRARRRFEDYKESIKTITIDDVYAIILKRDEFDIKKGSLIKPEGAIDIDNSGESLDKAMGIMSNHISKLMSEAGDK